MLTGIRVLVVDDDPDQTDMYAFGLGALGARVACAASVDDALAQLAREPVDAVISDVGLPGRDGYELARELRAAGARVPMVAVTGSAGYLERETALAAGFDEYCTKPLLPSELACVIARLVGRAPADRMD